MSYCRRFVYWIPCLALFTILIILGACSEADAQTATGDWTSRVSGEGWILECNVGVYHYDWELHLNSDSSGSHTSTLSDVTDAAPGFEDYCDFIGVTSTGSISYTISGSEISLICGDQVFKATISGNLMTGSGTYVATGVTYTWTLDLERVISSGSDSDSDGGITPDTGDDSDIFLGLPSTLIGSGAILAGIAGLGAAFLPAPSLTSASAPSGPQSLLPPEQSLGMPTFRPLAPPHVVMQAPKTGDRTLLQKVPSLDNNHLVPTDAPMQHGPDGYPDDYSGAPGTNGAMRCPYCGQETLSPFTVGWFCTNVLCPARRDRITKGYTHHKFNNMTWRQP